MTGSGPIPTTLAPGESASGTWDVNFGAGLSTPGTLPSLMNKRLGPVGTPGNGFGWMVAQAMGLGEGTQTNLTSCPTALIPGTMTNESRQMIGDVRKRMIAEEDAMTRLRREAVIARLNRKEEKKKKKKRKRDSSASSSDWRPTGQRRPRVGAVVCRLGALRPGEYITVHKGSAVMETVGTTSRELAILPAGEAVTVVEVVLRDDMKRIRGRIADPAGWISLENLENGYRWVRPAGLGELLPGEEGVVVRDLWKDRGIAEYEVRSARGSVRVYHEDQLSFVSASVPKDKKHLRVGKRKGEAAVPAIAAAAAPKAIAPPPTKAEAREAELLRGLRVGEVVEAFGLAGAAEWNGRTGTVRGACPSDGRVVVLFADPHGEKALKRDNLRAVQQGVSRMASWASTAKNEEAPPARAADWQQLPADDESAEA